MLSATGQVVELSSIASGAGGGFAVNGQSAGDNAGFCVSAAGDVNSDGLADLIIGAPRNDPPAGTDAGRAYVIFGKATTEPVDLSAIASGISPRGFVINGEAADDRAGSAVSCAGDVNGDGRADLIVGAPLADPGGQAGAGRAYVVFGKADMAPVDLSFLSTGTSALGFVMSATAAGENVGVSVDAAGDVNGDGLADVVVGAPYAKNGRLETVGRAYIVFGRTSSSAVSLPVPSAGFHLQGAPGFTNVGRDVAGAGDVNGDGLADVVVGAPGTNATRAYVIFGKTSTGNVVASSLDGSGEGFSVDNGAQSADGLGIDVSSAGDVNGDGLADVVVGARFATAPGGSNAGRAFVVLGRTTSTAVELSHIAAGTSSLGFVCNGQAPDDQAGRSVSSAGDVDGDGLADLLVAAPLADVPAGGDSGRCYVVRGRTATTAIELSALATGSSALGFVLNGEAAGDTAGVRATAAGDVNGDGLADLVVGASGADLPAGADAGRVYVVFSPMVASVSGTYLARIRPGDADQQAVGAHRFGDDKTIFPDSRAWLDFDSGSGPLGLASPATVTLTRNDAGLAGLAPANTADVQWHVSATRSGWTACRVTLRYTETEIAGLLDGSLQLVSAPSPAGPFSPVAAAAIVPARHEVSGEVSTLPRVFAITGTAANRGDADGDGSVGVADLTAIHNQLAGIVPPPLAGDGDVDDDLDVDIDDADALREFLVNGTPLP